MSEQKPRLLIVDDTEIIRTSLSRALNMHDIPHMQASSAREALKICATHNFTVIVSDIGMPEMDGLEFGKIIKEKYPDTHLIAFTGSVIGDMMKPLEAVFEKVYTKPSEISTLLDVTSQLISEEPDIID